MGEQRGEVSTAVRIIGALNIAFGGLGVVSVVDRYLLMAGDFASVRKDMGESSSFSDYFTWQFMLGGVPGLVWIAGCVVLVIGGIGLLATASRWRGLSFAGAALLIGAGLAGPIFPEVFSLGPQVAGFLSGGMSAVYPAAVILLLLTPPLNRAFASAESMAADEIRKSQGGSAQ